MCSFRSYQHIHRPCPKAVDLPGFWQGHDWVISFLGLHIMAPVAKYDITFELDLFVLLYQCFNRAYRV
jgi:hypothetical protein